MQKSTTEALTPILEDSTLSAKAKGIAAQFAAQPFTTADALAKFEDGEHSIRTGIRELASAGYIELRETRNGGRIETRRYHFV